MNARKNMMKTGICVLLTVLISVMFGAMFREHFMAAFIYATVMCAIPLSVIAVTCLMHVLASIMFHSR